MISRRHNPIDRPARRRGFTLTELLVTIAVFSVLAAVLLVGLNGAVISVQKTRTRSLIKKIDLLLMDKWNTYQTRRPPVTVLDQGRNFSGMANNRASRAAKRLIAIRGLQRLEMPDRFEDIPQNALSPAELGPMGLSGVLPEFPALSAIYRRKLNDAPDATPAFQSAECLYLIVMYGVIDEDGGRKRFKDSEIGDVDGDGLKEFVDAWGNPISFLRWAPGFSGDWPDVSEGSDLIKLDTPDPFDLMQVERRQSPPTNTFALYPLVYSYGPDEKGGIGHGQNLPLDLNTPYYQLTKALSESKARDNLIGAPIPPNAQTGDTGYEYEDNLHNHQAEVR